jgi:hypothetical protein
MSFCAGVMRRCKGAAGAERVDLSEYLCPINDLTTLLSI